MMHKKLWIILSVLAASVVFILCLYSSQMKKGDQAKNSNDNHVHLVLNSRRYNDSPKNFRKTSDLTSMKNDGSLNLNGLDTLNISGSQQFSSSNLSMLIKAIATPLPITVVDLRQESHGFINGLPVSWVGAKNNANEGLPRSQILNDEADKLKSIKLNVPITFYNIHKSIVPKTVQSEKELTASESLSYVRITVRDGGIPEDDMVDYFVEFVKKQPQSSWLHFHCKEGIGRTTTFMIMYDMMKNYGKASDDEIIKRQLALKNSNEKKTKSFSNKERTSFLKKFYEYCKKNGDTYNVKWSEWKKSAVSYNLLYKKAA